MKSVHEGDTLVVWKLDRLGRSARQLIDTVDALRERGAAFRSLTDALDTTTPRGRLVFHIFGGGRGYARRSEPSGRHDRAARVAC
jgi:DNA invertase Pin-like site-specific DNA recombinase